MIIDHWSVISDYDGDQWFDLWSLISDYDGDQWFDQWSLISDYDGDQWFSALQDMILYIALSEILWAIPALVKCYMCFTNGFDELFANVKPSIGYIDCDSLD